MDTLRQYRSAIARFIMDGTTEHFPSGVSISRLKHPPTRPLSELEALRLRSEFTSINRRIINVEAAEAISTTPPVR